VTWPGLLTAATKQHELRLGELRAQGLIEEKTVPQAHKESRNVVALTERGHRILRKASGLRKDQAIYHGYVKAREINHDADLYKVYQEAAKRFASEAASRFAFDSTSS